MRVLGDPLRANSLPPEHHRCPSGPIKRFAAFAVAGGVAANGPIRARLQDLCGREGVAFVAPPLALCTDNAAMIAWVGMERMRVGLGPDEAITARPRWPLDQSAAPMIGA